MGAENNYNKKSDKHITCNIFRCIFYHTFKKKTHTVNITRCIFFSCVLMFNGFLRVGWGHVSPVILVCSITKNNSPEHLRENTLY